MEDELAGLTLNEEEDAILQVQLEPNIEREEEIFRLVGCFLTASIIHFPTMKNTMANLWHPIYDVSIGLFLENLAVQLGNFVGEFIKYDGSNLGKENRNYMRVRVRIDVR
ncbi:hypothetical protein Goarm_017224, partial [Gossypium armourianum]|nr:hypothetical protein [Gossypium armourianum]